MKLLGTTLLVILVISAAAQTPADKVSHFRFQRDLAPNASSRLNYAVVDASIFRNSRTDLSDLRLYSGANEVPYVLHVEGGYSTEGKREARILNRGSVSGVAEMVLAVDMPEYDHIEFTINHAGDYISRATLAGANDARSSRWIELGNQTVFSLHEEGLGRNTRFQLKTPSTFQFLRVRFSAPILPDDVTGAYHELLQEQKARYVDVPVAPATSAEGKKTVIRWNSDVALPLERVSFTVDPAQVNFSRPLIVYCDQRRAAGGEISRVRLQRRQQRIESEDLSVNMSGTRCKEVRIEIENGDDRPVSITGIRAQMLERRLYFQPAGSQRITLYYGDEKLPAPRYDFARFFVPTDAAEATEAVWSGEIANAAYVDRADERPWTERHPAVMWAAMILAVAGLGVWAIRGFKNT
ncbi:MAG: DUF3999 family protein [Acidobacteriales bacterium]|nr:DUF3999 family protein [Terriglobales bacterium]